METRRTADGLEATVVRPDALSADQVEAWRALRGRDQAWLNPLFGPEFAQALGRAREDTRVAVYQRDGRLVGVWAHHRRPGGLGRPIGAPFSDYHGLVAAADEGLDGRTALHLAGLKGFRHNGLIDPDKIFDGLEEGLPGHAITLEGSSEAYLEGLRAASPKRFKNWRRLRHRLEELGPLRLEASRDPAHFNTLLRWKREQFARTGLHDVLRPAWVQGLMRDLFETPDQGLSGLMLTLHAGDQLVGGHFGVREGGVYHPWIASTDPNMAHASPGQAFLYHAILAMPDIGLTTYDLGTGHDHYKRPFANESRPTLAGFSGTEAQASRPMDRIRKRLDHIAATDLTLTGRARGVVEAAFAIGRRQASRREAEAD